MKKLILLLPIISFLSCSDYNFHKGEWIYHEPLFETTIANLQAVYQAGGNLESVQHINSQYIDLRFEFKDNNVLNSKLAIKDSETKEVIKDTLIVNGYEVIDDNILKIDSITLGGKFGLLMRDIPEQKIVIENDTTVKYKVYKFNFRFSGEAENSHSVLNSKYSYKDKDLFKKMLEDIKN